ncbi:MAG TPA: hypothetical protein DCM08_14605 [Microscillaceae bacterium]|nr:hypothetical protein [Microscillaceae bacterium]
MEKLLNNNTLSEKLRVNMPATGFTNRLKIRYRPYICPFNKLLALIPPNQKIFDIGCGSGMFLMLLAEYCQPQALAGIEIDEELIQNARHLLQQYPFPADLQVFNGFDLPPSIQTYDWVAMVDVLHHIPRADQKNFFERLYQVMRPGASLLIKDIDAASPLVYFNKLHDWVFAGEIGNEWKASALVQWLGEVGFQVKSLEKQNTYVYPHFTLIAER